MTSEETPDPSTSSGRDPSAGSGRGQRQDESPAAEVSPPEQNRRGLLPIAGGLGVIVIAFVLFFTVGLAGGGGGDGGSGPSGGLVTRPAGNATVEATIDLNRPTVIATRDPNAPIPGASAGDRFVIAKIGVDAPLSYKVVGPDGVMPNPNGPDDVAYYDFSGFTGMGGTPGAGGNTVFSGHVDSGRVACKNGTVRPPCEAVLWDLSRLRLGDEIEVRLGGQVYRYRVTSNQPVGAESADWDRIVSSTAQESITIITCGGDFNRETGQYDSRQVVTAIRV